MESKVTSPDWTSVSEIELVYKTKTRPSERPKISSPADSAKLLRSAWNSDKIDFVEQFKILLLNRGNRVLGLVEISTGGISGTVADPKVIFSAALKANASCIILSHNHPSGNLEPSMADERLTAKLKLAAEYLDITILDHIILSSEGYLSFAEKGLL